MNTAHGLRTWCLPNEHGICTMNTTRALGTTSMVHSPQTRCVHSEQWAWSTHHKHAACIMNMDRALCSLWILPLHYEHESWTTNNPCTMNTVRSLWTLYVAHYEHGPFTTTTFPEPRPVPAILPFVTSDMPACHIEHIRAFQMWTNLCVRRRIPCIFNVSQELCVVQPHWTSLHTATFVFLDKCRIIATYYDTINVTEQRWW